MPLALVYIVGEDAGVQPAQLGLRDYIDPHDVDLREAAGFPEYDE